ncbi:helix-turn-helix domain-containing protein [Desulfovibrio sp.]|uniref:helix-turn-helix domain-containing protein n=1 Tax=Desulfovibrio sp. TaxID=885 RepID=UPI003AB222AC
MPNFETRLKEERKRLGLKGGQLAQLGGVSAVSQSCYEKGKQLPGAAYLAAIAAVGVDVQYVLTGQRSADPVLTPKERLLLAAWKAASPELQTAVLAVLATGQSGVGGVNVGGDNNGLIAMNGGTIGEIKNRKK